MNRTPLSSTRVTRPPALARWRVPTTPLRWTAALVAAWLIALIAGVRLVLTPSLPHGAYRVLTGRPARGDMVMTCLPEPVARFALDRGYLWAGNCPGGVVAVGKVVTGVQGDTVTVGSDGVAVNGRPLPNSRARDRDSRGRPLRALTRGRRVIQPGELWLSAPYHPLSFDSRYFGPVPASSVVARLDPLWIW